MFEGQDAAQEVPLFLSREDQRPPLLRCLSPSGQRGVAGLLAALLPEHGRQREYAPFATPLLPLSPGIRRVLSVE